MSLPTEAETLQIIADQRDALLKAAKAAIVHMDPRREAVKALLEAIRVAEGSKKAAA